MDSQNLPTPAHKLSFFGKGTELFAIHIVNMILTVITLGMYYPWAKVAVMKYMYQATEFEGSRFTFHGKGSEIFMGFIKAVGLLILLGLINLIPILGQLIFIIGIFLITPIALHGSLKYRTSRSSWRGIHFGYRGDRNELINKFVVGAFLSAVTLGIYSSWFIMDLRRYTIGHIRFGNAQFKFTGQGNEYFMINLKGVILTMLTLGIYAFWYMRDVFNYQINNLYLEQEDRSYAFRANVTAGQIFELYFVNMILILITLGLALPWVMVRTSEFACKHIELDGEMNPNILLQTEQQYKDATGDSLSDMLDVDII